VTPAERQARALADALYPGAAVELVRVPGGYAVRVLRLGARRYERAGESEAQAWAQAAAGMRADAERELAAMAVRADRIGRALEVE
jgi:hypothetical protein